MVKITGRDRVSAKLRGIGGQDTIRKVGSALFAAGDLIAAEAAHSLTVNSQGGKHHVASLPGQPPNEDLGTLRKNIEVVQVAPLRVEVSSNAPYARALEYGTSRMGERPYMRPAVAKKKAEAVALVRQAVDAAIRQTQGA